MNDARKQEKGKVTKKRNRRDKASNQVTSSTRVKVTKLREKLNVAEPQQKIIYAGWKIRKWVKEKYI